MANKSRGILMFAHNNQEIDYFRLAVLNALLIQKHLGFTNDQVTIVTDKASHEYAIGSLGTELIEKACSNYIIKDTDIDFKYENQRVFKDTYYNPKVLPFYNINRCDAYDISPYEETILIDADYLIFSDALNRCWGHNNDIMMNWEYSDVCADRNFDELTRLNPLGITMYWATVVYFRKGTEAETFFNFVKHVRDNRDCYSEMYKFNNTIYRNDYSFSIAAHMMFGFKDKGMPQLPIKLFKTFDNDDIHKADNDTLYLYLEKARSPGEFMLTRWKGLDIHIMNKWAISRIIDTLMNSAQNIVEEPEVKVLKADPVIAESKVVNEKPKFNDINDALAAFKAMQEKKKADAK